MQCFEEIEKVEYRTPEEWLSWLSSGSASDSIATCIFGQSVANGLSPEIIAAIQKRKELYEAGLQGFVREFPERSRDRVFIVRSPARLNMRGMHIDNHGGTCNGFAIDRETILVASPK